MQKKTWKTALRAALLLPLLLAACGIEPDAPSTDNTPDAETTAPATPIQLSGEGAPAYSIVRGDIARQPEIDAAILLRKYLTNCGIETKITTDWEKNPVSEYEFVVGDTLRAEADESLPVGIRDVGEEGFFVAVSGTRVYLVGGSPATTARAVEHFLTKFFSYSGDAEAKTDVGTVTVPGDYLYIERQQYDITSVTVDGTSLAEYVIVPELSDKTLGKLTAETVQEKFYEKCGIWLEIADSAPAGKALRLVQQSGGEPGYFTVRVEDGDVLLMTDVLGGHSRGFMRFYSDFLREGEGDITLSGEVMNVDISSYVTYSEFGAVGDGKTNDIDALIRAHDYANTHGVAVRADEGATYYVSKATSGATIRTDTDWTGANFIIDDSGVGIGERNVAIFTVAPTAKAYTYNGEITPPARTATNLGITLPQDSIVVLTDETTKRYIREGKNANDGSSQTDIIVVDKDGNIDMNAPLIWDYTNLSSVRVIPMDETTLTIRGGTFTTVANTQPSASTYYARGIRITRSNVRVENIEHYVTGEGDQGAPYYGILHIQDCANITVENCLFTAHRTYTNNAKGLGTVSQGTYDISPSRVVNLTFKDCSQTTDILDKKYWGIMGSNFCKNIVLDGCEFSRFDAHQGVANVTIRNCTLGHQYLNAIGCGTLLVENTTGYGSSFINLRTDYGSTWEGEVIIRNCTWIPNGGNRLTSSCSLINGSYTGFHDFGYTCYMPATVTIDGLTVKDGKDAASYGGIYLFANFTKDYTGEAYEKKVASQGFPYQITEKVVIRGLVCESGKPWKISANTYMFRNVEVVEE